MIARSEREGEGKNSERAGERASVSVHSVHQYSFNIQFDQYFYGCLWRFTANMYNIVGMLGIIIIMIKII